MPSPLPRAVHPLAWWGWAIGLGAAASLTTNPLLLALIGGVVTVVVLARRGDSPWARAFRLYVLLAAVIVVVRMLLHVLVGLKYGTILLIPLPSVGLPDWAAGIELFGDVYLEGLLGAALIGARLGTLIIAIGGANALANPRRLLRALPNALHEVGTAVVVAISVAPQLAESVRRVQRARALRGDTARGIRVLPRVALPVLQDTLDRSLELAAAMESRGYGHRVAVRAGIRPLTAIATLGGLMVLCFGMYGLLDPTRTPGWTGAPVVFAGVLLVVAGLAAGGRTIRVSSYRPDPWRLPETLTLLSGLAAFAGVLATREISPLLLDQPLQPLAAPGLPPLAAVGILVAVLPAVLTPPPPAPRGRSQR